MFLVYFELDGQFDLVAATNNLWPSYLGNAQIKALKRGQNLEFKDRKFPRQTISGTIITHGPINIIEKVAEHFYSEKSKGKTVSEMNISVEYAFWEQIFREEDAAASVKEVDEYLRKTTKAIQSKNRKPNRENKHH